jgi:DNA-directed RNA polymerases I, II, and III subunit RPABC2
MSVTDETNSLPDDPIDEDDDESTQVNNIEDYDSMNDSEHSIEDSIREDSQEEKQYGGLPPLSSPTIESSDSNSESESDNEEYLKRFDRDVITNYVDIYHPESRIHNYDEVRAMSNVTRDKEGTVIDKLHKTIPFLTKFEKTRVLGLRAKQLNEGAPSFVSVPPGVVNGYTIALMELKEKKIPFIIRRPLPNGGSEYWKVNDLEIIL